MHPPGRLHRPEPQAEAAEGEFDVLGLPSVGVRKVSLKPSKSR